MRGKQVVWTDQFFHRGQEIPVITTRRHSYSGTSAAKRGTKIFLESSLLLLIAIPSPDEEDGWLNDRFHVKIRGGKGYEETKA